MISKIYFVAGKILSQEGKKNLIRCDLHYPAALKGSTFQSMVVMRYYSMQVGSTMNRMSLGSFCVDESVSGFSSIYDCSQKCKLEPEDVIDIDLEDEQQVSKLCLKTRICVGSEDKGCEPLEGMLLHSSSLSLTLSLHFWVSAFFMRRPTD